MEKAALFWSEYRASLVDSVIACPTDYALRADETAGDYAARVARSMRAAVEGAGNDFGRVNYRDSRAFRNAARYAGVAFTRAGLNSIYGG